MALPRFVIVLALTLSIWNSGLSAETATVVGRVVNDESQPLDSVLVIVVGKGISALTDEDGYYLMVGVRPGTHRLKTSRSGYSPVEKDLSAAAGQQHIPDFVLSKGDHIVPTEPMTFVRVRVRKARLRAGPSPTERVVGIAEHGDDLPLLAREGDWYQVRTSSASEAWIYGGIVSTNERVLYGLQHDRGVGDRGWTIVMKCSHWVAPEENTPLQALDAIFELGRPELEADYQDFRSRRGPYQPYPKWWIRDVVRRGGTAWVSFGGDVAVITERSGSTGAQAIEAQIVLPLLEFPGIHSVYLALDEGSHSGPGLRTRINYLDILPTPELEAIATDHPDPKCRSLAQHYLDFRRGK